MVPTPHGGFQLLPIMNISLRQAHARDAGTLSDLARRSKAHWGYPAAWIEQWRDALTITPEYIHTRRVVVACAADDVAGFSALEIEGDTATLDHLWIDPDRLGLGIGSALFRDAVIAATASGAAGLLIDSDPNAEAFYARMGAERAGDIRADVDGVHRTLPRMVLRLHPGQGKTKSVSHRDAE